MSDSIFTKIINREIPAEIIWENENLIILMDAFPQVDGQVLIVPKKQIDHFFDMEDDLYQEVFQKAKWISPFLREAFDTKRVVMVVEGFEVPHVHIKLYPANTGNQSFPKSDEALQSRVKENAVKIRTALLPKELK